MSKPLRNARERVAGALLICGALASFVVASTNAQDEEAVDFAHPTRHFTVPNPAQLSGVEALSVYDRIRDDMVGAYRLSRDPVAQRFSSWRRYNRVPYRSATHGERYVNNYANPEASKTYGRSDAGPVAPGAVLAKDSFTVTARGDVFTGPLFVMEKMPSGFAAETGNWRYTMIMPDGSFLGTTGGEGGERMAFCASCHESAGAENDYLFFVPEAFRIKFLGPLDAAD